jgi:hypothetical protein
MVSFRQAVASVLTVTASDLSVMAARQTSTVVKLDDTAYYLHPPSVSSEDALLIGSPC